MTAQGRGDIKKLVGSILSSENGEDLHFPKSLDKFKAMASHVRRFSKVLRMFEASSVMEKMAEYREPLSSFLDLFEREATSVFDAPPFSDMQEMETLVQKHPILSKEEDGKVKAFLAHYHGLKTSSVINTLLNTCSNLIPYRVHLSDGQKLDDRFLTRSSGSELSPVPDLNLNFKLLYYQADRLNEGERKLVLLVLHKLYTISHDLYEEYGKNDVDTAKFVEAVEYTIDELKKKIPGCADAFKQILSSTEMLRDNYGEYYKDYVSTKNPMIIAENFVIDVSQQVDASPRVAFQFKKILRELRKLINSTGMGGQYKEMMNAMAKDVNKNFDALKALEAEGTEGTNGAEGTNGTEADIEEDESESEEEKGEDIPA